MISFNARDLVPLEADYLNVSELPYIEGMLYLDDAGCYVCGEGVDVVGEMDGVLVLECRGCQAHMRGIEKVSKRERGWRMHRGQE